MEEIISMIFHGFGQVKELESNLPRLADHEPGTLSKSLEEIARTFEAANERLKMVMLKGPSEQNQMSVESGSESLLLQIDPSVMHEYWLRCGLMQGVDAMVQTQLVAGEPPSQTEGSTHTVEVSGSGKNTSSPRPPRKEEELRTVLVAAPRMGNTEIPPDDNYIWRKYGQKEILGSRFPRASYRCTHQRLYNCPAKKQVQRLDEDPHTFRVVYRGTHTCNTSATAPMSSSAGSSTARYGREVDYPAVADMADAMFNPGSSSGNSMDFIFHADHLHHHHHHHHHDQQDYSEPDKRK